MIVWLFRGGVSPLFNGVGFNCSRLYFVPIIHRCGDWAVGRASDLVVAQRIISTERSCGDWTVDRENLFPHRDRRVLKSIVVVIVAAAYAVLVPGSRAAVFVCGVGPAIF